MGFVALIGLLGQTEVILGDLEGRSWPVQISYSNSKPVSYHMADGWHKFVCDDELKRGDKCIIEMASEALRLKK